jgi:hypothetical protein
LTFKEATQFCHYTNINSNKYSSFGMERKKKESHSENENAKKRMKKFFSHVHITTYLLSNWERLYYDFSNNNCGKNV